MPYPSDTDSILAALQAYGGGVPAPAPPVGMDAAIDNPGVMNALDFSAPPQSVNPGHIFVPVPGEENPYPFAPLDALNQTLGPPAEPNIWDQNPVTSAGGSPLQFPPNALKNYLAPPAPAVAAGPGAVPRGPGQPALPKFDDVVGNRALEDSAQLDAGQALYDLETQKLRAQADLAARQATVQDQHNEAKTRANLEYQASRLKGREDADRETGLWMEKMEQAARSEPNPHRYWNDQSSFGKALWMLGMAFTSASQIGMRGAGQSNVVFDMLQGQIKADIESQKERQKREVDVLNKKGDIMLRNQGLSREDLKEDHAMLYQRLDSLQKAAMLRASAPGPEDQKAAWLAASAQVAEWKRNTLKGRADQAFQATESRLQRQHSAYQSMMDRDQARKLAKMSIDAADARSQGSDKAMPTLSRNTGFFIKDDKGNEVGEISVPEGRYAKVSAAATSATQATIQMTKLLKAVGERTATGWVLNSNGELNSAIEEAAAAVAQTQNPGGKITDDDIKRAKITLLGVDPSSWIAKVKGADRDKQIEMLEQRIQDFPVQQAREVLISAGISLPKGYDIGFIPPKDLVTARAAAPTVGESRATMGLSDPRPHPKSIMEFEAAEALEASDGAPGSVLPNLSASAPPLDRAIRNLKTGAVGLPPDDITKAAQKALLAIDKYKEANKGDPDAEANAEDAKIRVLSVHNKARAAATEALDNAVDWATNDVRGGTTGSKWTFSFKSTREKAGSDEGIRESVREATDKYRLTSLSSGQITELVNKVKARLKENE